MADENENLRSELEEKKIPVFTVLKNNSILKNIFLLDKPPSISDSNENGDVSNLELEEMLLVGRHPDCNIKLEHPSISRHHLQIYSKPSSQDLSVVDLSSVHGTWICGKKIEPGVRVHLKEGDSMQLGGSSRVYRLHWVPLSRAYDLDDPFMPPMEEQVTVPVNEVVEETHQEEEFMSHDNSQIQLTGDESGSSSLSFSNKNLKSCLKKVSPSVPQVPELQHSSSDDDDELQGFDAVVEEIVEETHQEENSISPRNNQIQSMRNELGSSNLSFPNKNLKSCLRKVSPSALPVQELLHSSSDDDDELQVFFNVENQIPQPSFVLESPQIQEEDFISHENIKIQLMGNELESLNLSFPNNNLKSCLKKVSFDDDEELQELDVENQIPEPPVVLESAQSLKQSSSNEDQEESCSSKMESEQREISSLICESILSGTSSPSSSIVYSTIEDQSNSNEENSTAESSSEPDKDVLYEAIDSENLLRTANHSQNEDSEEQLCLSNIWSRRGKPTGVQIQIQTSNADNISNKSISNALFDEDGEENFTSDKENFTPNTLLQRSMKNKNKMEEIKSFKKSRIEPEEMKRTRVVTRVPFQSLVAKSTSTEKSNIGGKTKRWVMVVDTSCLLNKESRKSLKLLQGLKGTQLIIPRTVLRELDSMKQRGRLFRRETEACLALQWIEECMMKTKTKQWIQVQSKGENGRSLAPTPTTLAPAVACGGLLEIFSPTAQDHVLECGLALRRTKNDGQQHIVLLSNDVALKIKAMAEGLLCEGAEEFREKLVNPFSERFLWGDSWPRGPLGLVKTTSF